ITKDEGNPKRECRTTLRGALGGFVTRMGIGVLYLRQGEAPSPAARMPACVQRSGRHLACRRAGHPARQNERVGAHLDTAPFASQQRFEFRAGKSVIPTSLLP